MIRWLALVLAITFPSGAYAQGVFPQYNSPASALTGAEQLPCVQPPGTGNPTRICTPSQLTTFTYSLAHGDCTASALGAISCTHGGTPFGSLATAAVPLAISLGGTGTTAPSLVAGSGISVTGSWPNQTIGFSGSPVTSVGETFTGGLISVAGSPITGAGTLGLTVAGTSGGLVYFNSPTSWASSPLLAAGSLMQGGGAGAAPSTFTLGGDCTFASPNITCSKSGGVAFGTFAFQNFAAPPAIGGTTPNNIFAAAFNAAGAATLQANVDINNQGADGSALFSTVGYGFPATKNGFFTSGTNALTMNYISNYFAQTALYAVTSRSAAFGETGLYLTFADATGYQNPATATTGQKAGIQVSAAALSGGGEFWGMAMSCTISNGWGGANGNFSACMEIDPINNDTGGSNLIYGFWLAGTPGPVPITSYLNISPYALGSGALLGKYDALYGISFGGPFTVQVATIWDVTNSGESYFDTGHHNYGASYAGAYAVAAINIGTAPIGIAMASGDPICFAGNVDCLSFSGNLLAMLPANTFLQFQSTMQNGIAWANDAGAFTQGTNGGAYLKATNNNQYFDNYDNGVFLFRGAAFATVATIGNSHLGASLYVCSDSGGNWFTQAGAC